MPSPSRRVSGRPPAILFDLDGTLLDSIELILNSARYAFEKLNRTPPPDDEWLAGIQFLTRTGQICDDRRQEWVLFSDVMAVSMLVGMQVNLMGISPIAMLFWTAVINGFLAPVLLVFIMIVSNSPKVMGQRRNSPFVNAVGWTATAVMTAAAIALIWTSVRG